MGEDGCEQHDSYLPKPEYIQGATSGKILIYSYRCQTWYVEFVDEFFNISIT